MYDTGNACQQQVNCAIGLVETDFYHPWNPGDILHFGADTNPWHANGHVATRLGEFLLYDEYDPRRTILFNPNGSVWKSGAAPTQYQFFLNFDATDGRPASSVKTDGDDAIFGDLVVDRQVRVRVEHRRGVAGGARRGDRQRAVRHREGATVDREALQRAVVEVG